VSLEKLTLDSIADGAASKLFERELETVVKNIADEKTEFKKERKVVLEVGFKPIDTRDQVSITVKAHSKLANRVQIPWGAQLQFDENGPSVYSDGEKQKNLFSKED